MLIQTLKQRGYEIVSQGDETDILLPKTKDKTILEPLEEILYFFMKKESFRKNFRDWAYGNKLSEEADKIVKSYITICKIYDKNFVEIEKNKDEMISKYAHTFEWFISELMCREFGAKESGFNIYLTEVDPDDEFDCIALIDAGLVFIECKTGEGTIFKELKKFVRRDEELVADYSFFIFDRDYTFSKKDKEDVPDIKVSEANKLGLNSVTKISADGSVFYSIVSGSRYFLATSGFDNLEKRLRLMIRYASLERGYVDTKKTFRESKIPFAKN